jgi:hypothetical protein
MPTLLLILLHPFRAAERLRQTPRWLGSFLLVAAGLVALRLAWHSHLVEMTLAALPATAPAEDRVWARSLMDNDLLLRCLFLPLRQVAGMGTFAFFLFVLCTAFAPPVRPRFKQIFALEIHAEIVNVVGACAAFAVTFTGGNEALLTSTKIFTLWYVVALTAGVVVFFGFPKLKAGLLASTAWVVSVLVNIFLLESVSASMHFHP